MDAYDLWKKMTRGCIFPKKRKINTVEPSEVTVQIKSEPVDKPNLNHDENEERIVLLNSFDTTIQKNRKRKIDESPDELEKKKQKLLEEKINQYRNENNINVVGRHIPEPIRTFEDLTVIQECLLKNVAKCGYTEPTAIQKQAIPVMLDNRQMLACAPTGSGKTAAFLLPIFHHLKSPQKSGFRALIICPTRELAKQTQRECLRLCDGINFSVHIISKIKRALTQYGPKTNGKYDILVTTPNRLCYLLNQDPPAINLRNVEWVIVDEADKLFEESMRGFREQLDTILNACTSEKRKIAMFSATNTPVVSKWCVHNMKGLVRVTIGVRNTVPNTVEQELIFVGSDAGKLYTLREIIRKGVNPPVLIFVQSKERAQQLFKELIYDGINVDAIHADRTQLQRDNTIRCFREGKIWFLICTELMARGVNFLGINLVINYDFPLSTISYIHRVGRAGRAGRKGKAITFFTKSDTANLRSVAHIVKQSGYEVPEYLLTLEHGTKNEKKKLKMKAPKRPAITTTPKYAQKKHKRGGRRGKKKNVEEEMNTENA